MKRILKVILCILLLSALSAPSYAAKKPLTVYVDWAQAATDPPPVIINGRTLVPLRQVFEAMGMTVEWDAAARVARASRFDAVVVVPIDSKIVYVDADPKRLDVPAQIIDGHTMVPIRLIFEAMGCVVSWNGDSNTVAIADQLRDQRFYAANGGTQFHFREDCAGGAYAEVTLAEVIGRGLTPCGLCLTGDDD